MPTDMAGGANGERSTTSGELAALDYAMLAIDTLLDPDSADPSQADELEANATTTYAALLSLRGQIARGER
jgi:hypothetical protein